MASHKRKTTAKTTTLLSLPAELRNHIYQILLIAQHPILLVREDDGPRATVRVQNWYEASPSANILATSKQINREAAAYLYSDNTFTFRQDPRALSNFLARIKKSAKLVRHINIVNPYPKQFGALALKSLELAPSLAKLEIAYVPRFVYDVAVMAGLLLPWARARKVDSMTRLQGLEFYHTAFSSAKVGSSRAGTLGSNEADKVVQDYTREVRERLLRLLKVKKA